MLFSHDIKLFSFIFREVPGGVLKLASAPAENVEKQLEELSGEVLAQKTNEIAEEFDIKEETAKFFLKNFGPQNIYVLRYQDIEDMKQFWKLLETGDTADAAACFRTMRRQTIESIVREAANENGGRASEAIRNFPTYEKDDPAFAEKMLRAACELDPISALEFYGTYKHCSYAPELLERAARKSPSSKGLEYFKLYANELYAEDIIANAILNSHSGAALKEYSLWQKAPYAQAALDQILHGYKDFYYGLVGEDAEAVFQTYHLWSTHPVATEVLNKTVQDVMEGEPHLLVLYPKAYTNFPDAQKIFEVGVEATIQKNPMVILQTYQPEKFTVDQLQRAAEKVHHRDILEDFPFFKNAPNAGKILKQAVQKAALLEPDEAFKYYPLYKDELYADSVLLTAVRNAHIHTIFKYFDFLKEKPWIEDQLVQQASKNGIMLTAHFDKIIETPYAGNVILMLLESNDPQVADFIMANFGPLKHKRYAEQLAFKCAEVNPAATLNGYRKYQNETYAQNVLALAFKNVMQEKFFDAKAIFANVGELADEATKEGIIMETVIRARKSENTSVALVAYFDVYRDIVQDASNIVQENFYKALEAWPRDENLTLLEERRVAWESAFADTGERERVIHALYSNMAQYNPEWILAHKDTHQDFVMEALEHRYNEAFLIGHPEFYREKGDLYAKNFALDIAKKKPQEAFFAYLRYRAKLPWAEVVLETAVNAMRANKEDYEYERNGDILLKHFDVIAGKPYAGNTMKEIMTRKELDDEGVDKFFRFFYLFEQEPYIGDVVLLVAEQFPASVFFQYDRLSPQYAPKVMLTIANKEPGLILENPDKFTYSEEVIEKAARRVIESERYDTLIGAFEFIEHKPYAEELLMTAAKHKPRLVIYNKAIIGRNDDYGKDIIKAAEAAIQAEKRKQEEGGNEES